MKTTFRNILFGALLAIGLGVPYLQAADVAISALPAASTLGGTEPIPVVQSGATKRSTPAAIKTYVETGGTVTASDPVLDLTQTWNNGAVAFTSIKLNVTNTASETQSKLQDWQIGGTSVLSLRKDGTLGWPTGGIVPATGELRLYNNPATSNFGVSTTGAAVSVTESYSWTDQSQAHAGTKDLIIRRDAAGVLAQRNGTNAQTLRVYDTYTDASNYSRLALNAGAAGDWVQVAAETAGTGADNIGIALTPTGIGAISAQVPDSTAAGGNARGINSVDWQTSRGATASLVASGSYSVISGGSYNAAGANWAVVAGGFANSASNQYTAIGGGSGHAASGIYSTVSGGGSNTASGESSAVGGGAVNTASGAYSWVPGGAQATTRGLLGAGAYSAGRRTANGDAQVILQTVRVTTSATSAATLTADGAAESATNVMVLPINSGADFEARVVAVHASGAAAGSWNVTGTARRAGSGNAVIVGTPTVTARGVDAGLGSPTIAVVALTGAGAGAIAIQVTPANTTTTYWVGRVELIQAG